MAHCKSSRGAVNKGDAHQHDAGGEGTHQEIFERSFVAAQVFLVCTCKDVQWDRKDLDTEEQHQQAIERTENADTAKHKEDECIIFACIDTGVFKIAAAQHHIE